ncbi:hypothetical protein RvY_14651 [Ramazzottius varieornatus]|uniref:Uncharacterized protein n=1 Tax=Ramazzottius varieornatus TaxID=947166 RepID=A0A1D1VVU0_RAMVA|nr:hypothetical protein RvY_14651 [Ramazzottius varieornatus]
MQIETDFTAENDFVEHCRVLQKKLPLNKAPEDAIVLMLLGDLIQDSFGSAGLKISQTV